MTAEGNAQLRGLWRLLQPVLAADIRKGAKDELEAVKRHAEAP